MGFSFRRKKSSVERERDRIWKTQAILFDGVLAEVEAVANPSESSLLIAHFRSTYKSLVDFLTAKAVVHKTYSSAMEGYNLGQLVEYQPGGQVLVCLADSLPRAENRPKGPGADSQFTLSLMVVEHHPLPGPDDQIEDFAASLPCSTRLCFNDALDSALMCRFGGEQVAGLMGKLNIPDSEPISHPIVDRTLRQAQQRIARRTHNPMLADSPEQWFEMNLREAK